MNLKVKTAVAALVMGAGLLGAGTASAAMIATGANGGVLFSGWSQNSGQSYSFGLTGVDYNTFAANPQQDYSFTLNGFGTFLSGLGANGSDFRWTVGAADTQDNGTAFGGYGLLTTGASNGTLPAINNSITKNAGLNQANFVNGDAPGNASAGCSTAGAACIAASTDSGYVGDTIKDTWQLTAGSFSNGSEPAVGTSLPFYLLTSSSNQSFAAANKTTLAGTWKITLSGADALLTYTAAPVPLPAAFWLLASGIAGFAGVARRSKGAVTNAAVAA